VIAPVAPCTVCDRPAPTDWDRCGHCGAQRLLDAAGAYARHARPAATWRRIAAGLVDLLLVAVPAALTYLLPPRVRTPGGSADEALVVLIVTAWLLYPTVALGARGRTLGKGALGIHVVCADGSALTFPRAAAREGVAKVVEAALALPVGVVSLASIPFDERRQALHDKVARTVVVDGAPAPRPGPAVSGRAAAASAPAREAP
jgi:uncharacterized RDD family membrane protein YckC